MKQREFILLCLMASVAIWAKAQNRNWQTGILSRTEPIKVREGSTETATIAGYLNDSRNSFSPANTPTTTTTPDFETYQEFKLKPAKKYMSFASICSTHGPSPHFQRSASA